MNIASINNSSPSLLSAPVMDIATGLVGEYHETVSAVKAIHQSLSEAPIIAQNALNRKDEAFLDDLDSALRKVDVNFWLRLLTETRLADFMESTAYSEMKAELRNQKSPQAFTEENIKSLLELHILGIEHSFATRIDNLFKSLSGNHVTNSPSGFRQRMIIENFFNSYSEEERKAQLRDLLCCVALINKQSDLPTERTVSSIFNHLKDYTGSWFLIQGGNLRAKGFKKGTLHIEVSMEIADTFNDMLSRLYPKAIAEHKKQPKRLFKSSVIPTEELLPEHVRSDFSRLHIENRKVPNPEFKKGDHRVNPFITVEDEYQMTIYKPHADTVEYLTYFFGAHSETRNEQHVWGTGAENPREIINYSILSGSVIK
ncbi:hypothetical protein VCHA53O466_320029 [Vibrio chagasii]|nr:hypothetical protein VCHA53O466_320029 [Vibrio chagasii]